MAVSFLEVDANLQKLVRITVDMDPTTCPAIKKIRKLSPDGRLWRVDWFCGISGSADIANDRLINIIISPFKQDFDPYENPSSAFSVDYQSRETIQTSIGNLPYIHIGSVWKNGEYQDTRSFNYTEKILSKITLDDSTMKIVSADHRLENGSYLIDKKYWPISIKEGLNAKCLCIKNDNDPYGIIIPMTEVIRFYYATSSKVIHHLVSDSYFRTDGNCIYDRSKSGYLDEFENAIIHLRKDFERNDSWAAARLAFDDVAHNNAVKIYTSIAEDWRKGLKTLHPETFPPFTGKTSLLTYGKNIQSGDGKWRFLIFWIAQCSAPFPFRDLSYSRDNPGNSSKESGEKETEYPPRDPKPGEPSEFMNQDEEAPSSHTEPTRIILPPRFTALAGKSLDKIIKDANEYRSKKTIVKPLKERPTSFSTSPPTSGESSSAPAGFTSDEKEREIIYNYERLLVMLNGFDLLMADGIINGWSMISVVGCHYSTKLLDANHTLLGNLFPPTDRNGIELPKSFTHHDTSPQRGMMVVEILTGGQCFYLLEILRKKYENFSAVLIFRNDFSKLDQEILFSIVIECAKNEGRWLDTINVPGINRHRVTHRWKSSEAFASRMKGLLEEING